MKIRIGNQTWQPKDPAALEGLKKKIAAFLEEQAGKKYKIDDNLKNNAGDWFNQSKFPGTYLKEAETDFIVISEDHIGFPFEILWVDGAFLGETYRVYRTASSEYQPNQNFKICYQFEESDKAHKYYDYLVKNFPVDLIGPPLENISANVFHVTGHFEGEEKEKVIRYPINKNVLLFFNSCCTFKYSSHEKLKSLNHLVLSYFDIPLENPGCVEDFPYFFYRFLLEGEEIAAAFLKARRKYINETGILTPLLFTLFTSDPAAHIFYTPYANHHKEIEKEIKRIEGDAASLKDNARYPFFRFEGDDNRGENIQAILNSGESRIWVRGAKAGIGKTTLLYKVFQLFKFGKYSGPLFISFKEDRGLGDLNLKNAEERLFSYLKIDKPPAELSGKGKKYLILIDAIESNKYIYDNFSAFADELDEIFGSCAIIAVSRNRCPAAGFLELGMEITAGDENARQLRKRYGIEDNIKLPDIPLIYKLFSQIRERAANVPEMNKSEVFETFTGYYQQKTLEDQPVEAAPDAFLRYFSILANIQFRTGSVFKNQFLEALNTFRKENKEDMDWWIFDNKRGHYRDAESVYKYLLSTDIIINSNDRLYFIHDSFYEYFLATYFYWQGLDDSFDFEGQRQILMYTEVPDYMKEMVKTGVYADNHPPGYLRVVFDRLFYIRDYKGIEAILVKEENQAFIKASEKLWDCFVKGCYYARNPGKNIDEVRAFKWVAEFYHKESFFDIKKLSGPEGQALREIYSALLNILFDNNLLEEFFRLALFLKGPLPTLQVYGLLSRGYLKINEIDKAREYLELKEAVIKAEEGNEREREKNQIRLHAEKGLLYYFKYLETSDKYYFNKGIVELKEAEDYYRRDKREEWNYLFTLREFLRYYLTGREPEKFDDVILRLDHISINAHPKTDYIPYLNGIKKIVLEDNVDSGVTYLLKGAEGFLATQLPFEAAVVYLWVYYYYREMGEASAYLKKAYRIFKKLEEKRARIKASWKPFDEHLKEISHSKLPAFFDPFEALRKIFGNVDKKDEDRVDFFMNNLKALLDRIILIS